MGKCIWKFSTKSGNKINGDGLGKYIICGLLLSFKAHVGLNLIIILSIFCAVQSRERAFFLIPYLNRHRWLGISVLRCMG